MRTATPLLCCAAICATAHAETRFNQLVSHRQPASANARGAGVIYETAFESLEGYTLGELDGQQGWDAFDAQVLDTIDSPPISGQAAHLIPSGPTSNDYAEALRELPADFGELTIDLLFTPLDSRGTGANASLILYGPEFDLVCALGFDVQTQQIMAVTDYVSPPVVIGAFTLDAPCSLRLVNAGDGRQQVYIDGELALDALSFAAGEGLPEQPTSEILLDADSAVAVFDNINFDRASQCPTDFDGDGVVGSRDLAAVLAAWGVCP